MRPRPEIRLAFALGAASALALFGTRGQAAGTVGPGPTFGLRAGAAFPAGQLQGGDKLSSNYSGMVPIWIDAGYRITPQIYGGVYVQYAVLFVSSDVCQPPLKCSADDWRFGANVHIHPLAPTSFTATAARSDLDPWVGLGAGYEIATVRLSNNGARASRSDGGFELVNIQAGLDYRALERLGVGAFAGFSLGQFSHASTSEPADPSYSGRIQSQAVHEWILFGIMGRYDF